MRAGRGAAPCGAVRSRGVLGLLGVVSPSRVMRRCPTCPRRCAWYEGHERRMREAVERGRNHGA